MLYPCAYGDLNRPAHNQPYSRATRRHYQTAVPLGCGQLGSGSGLCLLAALPLLLLPYHSSYSLGLILWVEWFTFGYDRPGNPQQLAGCRTTRHLFQLSRGPQALIKRFDDWVVLGRAQGCHVQGCPQTPIAAMADPLSPTHTYARVKRHRCQASIADRSLRSRADPKIDGCDHQPSRSQQPNPLDGLKPCCCGCPSLILEQCRCYLGLNLGDLVSQGRNQLLDTQSHRGNHHWRLDQRVQLVANLLAQGQQRITLGQTLLEFIIDRRRWRPALGLECGGQLGQGLGINRVGFGALEQGFSEMMRLHGVNDADGVACAVQGGGQANPIRAGGLHNDQSFGGRDASRVQTREQLGNAGGCLLNGERARDRLARLQRGAGGGGRGDIDPDEQTIRAGRQGRSHSKSPLEASDPAGPKRLGSHRLRS